MTRKGKIERISPDFQKDMQEVAKVRLQKGLVSFKASEMSVREMTELLRRTTAYPNVLEELKSKPKRI